MSGFLCSMVGATFSVAAAAEVLRAKKGIVAVANAQIDTAQSKFGGASALFDGTGDYLQIANSSDFNFGSGAFTIEGWIRPVDTSGFPGLIGMATPGGTDGWNLQFNSSGQLFLEFRNSNNNGVQTIVNTSAFSMNTWGHFAFTREGNTVRAFKDGTLSASVTVTYALNNSTANLLIGEGYGIQTTWGAAPEFNGHIDEIRISNTARYTTTFTPSTSPFVNDANTLLLIHADGTDASTFFEDDNGVRAPKGIIAIGNAQVDTAQSKFGGSSYLGDGTGDYLTVDNLAITGDFTYECFVRFNALPGSGSFMMLATGDGNRYFGLLNNSGTYRWESSVMTGSNQYVARYTPSITTGVWYHIALVKSGSTLTLYHNGTAQTATTIAGSMDSSSTLFNSSSNILGAYISNNYSLNGWMDEIRISNSARYTANFTPSTSAFVNDANTLLLIHADGTDGSTVFLDDNSGVPTTAPTTAVSFDGTDDYYSVTGLTTTATDSKYLTIAFTWFHGSGGNSRNQHFMTARLGTTSGENGWEVCLQQGRFRYSSYDNSGSNTDLVYGDAQHTVENAYNQMVAYIDHTSFANCKWYVNGVDRTSSLLNGAAVGAVNLANNNINWGSSNVSIRIGEQDSNSAYNSGFSDFLGRISQIHVHNASGAPDINKFWYFGSNRPRDLGTNGTATGLAQPLIYHYGNTTTFAANNGTGFNAYTLTASGNVATGDGPNYA